VSQQNNLVLTAKHGVWFLGLCHMQMSQWHRCSYTACNFLWMIWNSSMAVNVSCNSFSSAEWANSIVGQRLSTCVYVNHGGPNHNRYTQTTVILHVIPWRLPPDSPPCIPQILPLDISPSIFACLPAESHSPWAACYLRSTWASHKPLLNIQVTLMQLAGRYQIQETEWDWM